MSINIGLTDKDRKGVVSILNQVLADEFVLYTKTRNFHWNVTGRRFHDLHKFFEEQYETLDVIMDEVAERVRKLDGTADGTLSQFSSSTKLKENPGVKPKSMDMVDILNKDHESTIRSLREYIELVEESFHDVGTQDFLTGVMEQHEKMAWMLRSVVEED